MAENLRERAPKQAAVPPPIRDEDAEVRPPGWKSTARIIAGVIGGIVVMAVYHEELGEMLYGDGNGNARNLGMLYGMMIILITWVAYSSIRVSQAAAPQRIAEARKQQRINELLLEELEEKKRNRSRRAP